MRHHYVGYLSAAASKCVRIGSDDEKGGDKERRNRLYFNLIPDAKDAVNQLRKYGSAGIIATAPQKWLAKTKLIPFQERLKPIRRSI
jgi:hypothetical protein